MTRHTNTETPPRSRNAASADRQASSQTACLRDPSKWGSMEIAMHTKDQLARDQVPSASPWLGLVVIAALINAALLLAWAAYAIVGLVT